jgi:MFS family permease
MSVNTLALGVGMAIAGPVTDAWGARWAWVGAALAYAVAAAVGYVLARGVSAEPVEDEPEGEPEPARALAAVRAE